MYRPTDKTQNRECVNRQQNFVCLTNCNNVDKLNNNNINVCCNISSGKGYVNGWTSNIKFGTVKLKRNQKPVNESVESRKNGSLVDNCQRRRPTVPRLAVAVTSFTAARNDLTPLDVLRVVWHQPRPVVQHSTAPPAAINGCRRAQGRRSFVYRSLDQSHPKAALAAHSSRASATTLTRNYHVAERKDAEISSDAAFLSLCDDWQRLKSRARRRMQRRPKQQRRENGGGGDEMDITAAVPREAKNRLCLSRKI